MIGWLADLVRLAVGLVYWNTRKTWFQVRRGRSSCPCQSLSDSGKAYETQCEACVSWHKPVRFRRVCPLLVETKDGLRCSANTPDVRPFWARAFGWYGGAALAAYGIGAIGVFIFLRTVGYPVSIVHVALPPLWHRVTEVRGWFFLERSQRAFAAGKTAEGLLYLANSYEFDPKNYAAGISLAKNLQIGQAAQSDKVFAQLMREHPDKKHLTAQEWFRALLPRGSFDAIIKLARDELLADSAQSAVWVRVLLFATHQSGNDTALKALVASNDAGARTWRPVLQTELLVRERKTSEARRALLAATWPFPTVSQQARFMLFYRVDTLIELGEPNAGLDLLLQYPRALDDEADATLKLDAFATIGSQGGLKREVDLLLDRRLTANLSVIKIICAHLIRHPNPGIFEQVWIKIAQEQMPMNTETIGPWFSLLCAAGAVGDRIRLHEITARLKQASKTPFVALGAVEAFFRGESTDRRITTFLPILPLPLEVTYALFDRYGTPSGPPVAATKRA